MSFLGLDVWLSTRINKGFFKKGNKLHLSSKPALPTNFDTKTLIVSFAISLKMLIYTILAPNLGQLHSHKTWKSLKTNSKLN